MAKKRFISAKVLIDTHEALRDSGKDVMAFSNMEADNRLTLNNGFEPRRDARVAKDLAETVSALWVRLKAQKERTTEARLEALGVAQEIGSRGLAYKDKEIADLRNQIVALTTKLQKKDIEATESIMALEEEVLAAKLHRQQETTLKKAVVNDLRESQARTNSSLLVFAGLARRLSIEAITNGRKLRAARQLISTIVDSDRLLGTLKDAVELAARTKEDTLVDCGDKGCVVCNFMEGIENADSI